MDRSAGDEKSHPSFFRWETLCGEYELERASGTEPELRHWLAQVTPSERGGLLRLLLSHGIEPKGMTDEDRTLAEESAPQIGEAAPETSQSCVPNRNESLATVIGIAPVDVDAANDKGRSRLASAPTLPEPDPQDPCKPPLPARFGRYRILRTLGSGAMGTVCLAEDTQLQRQVALKTSKFDDDLAGDGRERFYREARLAATLRHPNICPVYDVGEIDGRHFISMAYIEGRPLSAHIAGGKRFTEKQALVIVRKLALALQDAHDHGVIHRDLKPGNVMIDGKGEPIVTDFGLARATNPVHDARLTQSGMLIGSPAYMSPEQIEADRHRVTAATDQYSLGVILYELLTRQLPFQERLPALAVAIATREPTRPGALRPGLDPRIEALCLKMMAKSPANRFGSLTLVAAEVDGLSKRPAGAPGPSSEPAAVPASSKQTAGASRGVRTNRTIALVAVSGLLAAVAAFALSRPARNAALPIDEAGRVAAAATGETGKLRPAGSLKVPSEPPNDVEAERFSGAVAGQAWDANRLGMKFRWCPSGAALMGSPEEEAGRKSNETQVRVTLSGFWMGKLEVTQQEWQKVMGTTLRQQQALLPIHQPILGESPLHPMYFVNHDEATAFCAQLTEQERKAGTLPAGWEFRLPTEAQWEHACRASTTTPFAVDGETELPASVSPGVTGLRPANPWGLHDMHGNVAEWCRDWFYSWRMGGEDPVVLDPDKGFACSLRGGSYKVAASERRSAARSGMGNQKRAPIVGFRVCIARVPADPPDRTAVAAGTKPGQVWAGNGLQMKFCWCPPGNATLGSPPEETGRDNDELQVRVAMGGFWMGKFEVTQTQWHEIMGTTLTEMAKGTANPVEILIESPRRPMHLVNHADGTEFCQRLTRREREAGRLSTDWEYRLPTEAQWEYACRARTETRFWFGEDEAEFETCEWCRENANSMTRAVGEGLPNPWGLCDMLGNVSELCRDWYFPTMREGRDPEATEIAAYRVVRGGSCLSSSKLCRSAQRGGVIPTTRNLCQGFRVVLVRVEPSAK